MTFGRRGAFLLLPILLAALALDAQSQGMPRRDRLGSPRDSQQRDRDAAKTPSPAQDPVSALERELPSLEVDLFLSADQLAAWTAFERSVREVAELDRSRRRHIMALRDSSPERPATALTFVAAIAEDDRLKLEATNDMRRSLESLYDKLDGKQRAMLDRRVLLSQTEPLGR